MTTLFDIAVETARQLPPEKQDDIARLVLQMASEDQSVYRLSEEELAEVHAGLQEADQDELVDEAQARKLLNRFK
ncbi:hypothetical protein ASD54_05780 [Rhizobium sp. Root149]|jgi:hypothetical protein|uniref:Uncharacterized protein n=1 Tax=Rhizobium rhizoryzae TaxID=451876 RepID=A0A7W6LCP5_9HYPH|nr:MULTISPECIES: hypothetical protein [Rhizobium]KQZ54814.1 hypothetical protein ASD54_05780 [Rhizobium sp. Root149]MBB4141924.1 hypothetical protein [Rhizobium rhizoryzae]